LPFPTSRPGSHSPSFRCFFLFSPFRGSMPASFSFFKPDLCRLVWVPSESFLCRKSNLFDHARILVTSLLSFASDDPSSFSFKQFGHSFVSEACFPFSFFRAGSRARSPFDSPLGPGLLFRLGSRACLCPSFFGVFPLFPTFFYAQPATVAS